MVYGEHDVENAGGDLSANTKDSAQPSCKTADGAPQSLVWCRLTSIGAAFDAGYEWVLFLDSDVLFMSGESIADFLERLKSLSLPTVKSGVYMAMTSPTEVKCGVKNRDEKPYDGCSDADDNVGTSLEKAALIMPIDVGSYGQNAGVQLWHNVPKAKWLLSKWYLRNINGCCNRFPAEQGAFNWLVHMRKDVSDLVARVPASKWTYFASEISQDAAGASGGPSGDPDTGMDFQFYGFRPYPDQERCKHDNKEKSLIMRKTRTYHLKSSTTVTKLSRMPRRG
jgi:hypothetical protein